MSTRRQLAEQTELLRSLERTQHEVLEELRHRVDQLESTTIVADEGGSRAADAYDNLRRAIQVATRSRTSLLVALAEIDRTLRESHSLDAPRMLVDAMLRQEGVAVSIDTANPAAFRIVGGEGEHLEVIAPAYIDENAGRVVAQGTARLVDVSGSRRGTPR